jgi:hypothetical protein
MLTFRRDVVGSLHTVTVVSDDGSDCIKVQLPGDNYTTRIHFTQVISIGAAPEPAKLSGLGSFFAALTYIAYIWFELDVIETDTLWSDLEPELFTMPKETEICPDCGFEDCCCVQMDVDHWVINSSTARFLALADEAR